MSVDRHNKLNGQSGAFITILPHRTAPPSPEEIFGLKKAKPPSPMEFGMLQMQILWMLNRKSTHGYEIMEALNKIKSTKVAQGTLYPALKSLKRHGYIRGTRADDRIIYDITPEGKKALNDSCMDFTRTFFGIFQDFVCHKCVGGEKK